MNEIVKLSENKSHFGLRLDSIVLLIGIGFEAASVAIGDWITTWYGTSKAMNYLMLDFAFYISLLLIIPSALAVVKDGYTVRNIVIFLFSWIFFIFIFTMFSQIGLF